MEFDRPLRPWRDTLALAHKDAIQAGVAVRDGEIGPVYIIVPARIEIEREC
ncbi:hypothetical protein [Flavisphingomonas formosensis]|uniref:hypothetical protein n=1 Tax=Flavisphingomonas formosensis TaxID=861534 RepID=UPI0012F8E29B|nr:hypothetical protein [Sphingomonas formosensis]